MEHEELFHSLLVDMLCVEQKQLEADELMHIGTSHLSPGQYTGTGSGRYSFGTGENPNQHDFGCCYSQIHKYREEGMTDEEIKNLFQMNTSEWRKAVAIAKDQDKQIDFERTKQLYQEKGLSNTEIAKVLGCSEGTVRNMIKRIDAGEDYTQSKLRTAVDALKSEISQYEGQEGVIAMLDVGKDSERYLGISETMKKNALEALQAEGYIVHNIQVAQVTNSNGKTTVQLLAKIPEGFEKADASSISDSYVAKWKESNPEKAERMSDDDIRNLLIDQRTVATYAYNNLYDVHPVTTEILSDNDEFITRGGIVKPQSISSDRVMIAYGADKDGNTPAGSEYESNLARDGTMILRPSAQDLTMTDCDSLRNSHYAQVRIGVDDTHYLKGMAMYGREEQFPDGVDVIFYTNKSEKKDKMDVIKSMKTDENGEVDMTNPFGAALKVGGQRYYIDSETGEKKLSAVNILKEEGDWNEYSKSLAAQFLSKQNIELVKERLDTTVKDYQDEFDSIASITQPEIRKQFLEKFADECDSNAVDMKASAVSGQLTQVILPLPSLKDDEVYAPSYPNGTQLAIVRYPHANICEIPIVTVNNNNKDGITQLGRGLDAIGLSKASLDQLSGADTDGDTGICIPLTDLNKKGLTVDSTPYFKELVGWDDKAAAPYVEGVTEVSKDYSGHGSEGRTMTKQERGQQMGLVTNLIMDMTVIGSKSESNPNGVTHDEMVRAMKYSMITIDAYKHGLDWKNAIKDLGITELYSKYASRSTGGGTTLFTRAKSTAYVDDFNEYAFVTDPKTGKTTRQSIDSEGNKLYSETGKTYTFYKKNEDGTYVKDENGNKVVDEVKKKTVGITKLEKAWREGDDATSLISRFQNPKEIVYAEFSNTLHEMGKQARLLAANTPSSKTASSETKAEYAEEIASINDKLEKADMNSPRERLAQMYATQAVNDRKKSNPSLKDDAEHLKKIKTYETQQARNRTGADGKSTRIKLTQKEYEAIEAGCLNKNTLSRVLKKCDQASLRSLATPKANQTVSESSINRIRAQWDAMQKATAQGKNAGTQKDLAEQFGVSVDTISKIVTRSGAYADT